MTPNEYLAQLAELVIARKYAEVMVFAKQWSPIVYPRTTGQEYQDAATLLETPTLMLATKRRTATAPT